LFRSTIEAVWASHHPATTREAGFSLRCALRQAEGDAVPRHQSRGQSHRFASKPPLFITSWRRSAKALGRKKHGLHELDFDRVRSFPFPEEC
jgi:hypothetical protein